MNYFGCSWSGAKVRKRYISPRLSSYGHLLNLTRSENGDGEDADFLGSRPATKPNPGKFVGSHGGF